MKFTISLEQRDFYKKQGWLELELFSQEQLYRFNKQINAALEKKTGKELHTLSHDSQFMEGHDLFREEEELKRQLSHPRITDLVYELVLTKPFRLAFDQFYPSAPVNQFDNKQYSGFLTKSYQLEMSCVGGLLCGVLIALNGENAGNAKFISPKYELPFEEMTKDGHKYFLVGYSEKVSQYLMNENDPHVHTLKHIGYVFGDRLNDQQHPIVFR